MRRVQFSVTYPDRLVHPLHRQIVEGTSLSRAELLMWSPTEDATTLVRFDGPREAAERAIERIDSLQVSHFVADGSGTYAFLRQDDYEFASALLETIEGSRVIFFPPVVFLDTGAIRFEAAGATESLSAFHDSLSELGNLAVERVQDFERTRSPSRLTDRQEAALEAAVSAGYYDVPREGTVADVATILECSTSTAGELLRKAEAAVIRNFTESRE
ncbi:helix-turn-helix domain-containing protein [Halosimplex sp. J119]